MLHRNYNTKKPKQNNNINDKTASVLQASLKVKLFLRHCCWSGDLHWFRDEKCDEYIKPWDKGIHVGTAWINGFFLNMQWVFSSFEIEIKMKLHWHLRLHVWIQKISQPAQHTHMVSPCMLSGGVSQRGYIEDITRWHKDMNFILGGWNFFSFSPFFSTYKKLSE